MASPPSSPLSVAVRGKISVEDVELARSLNRRGGVWSKAIAIVVTLLAAMICADTATHAKDASELKLAGPMALIAGVGLVVAFLVPRIWRPYEPPGFEIARTINGDGIDVKDQAMRGYIPWSKVARGKRSESMAIVYMQAGGAFIFPRRVFASQDDWRRFCELFDRYAPSL